jgi:carboxyl-terminal processing protease
MSALRPSIVAGVLAVAGFLMSWPAAAESPLQPHAQDADAVLGSPAWNDFLAHLHADATLPVDEPLLRLACRAGLAMDRPANMTAADVCIMAALRGFDHDASYETAAMAAERRRSAARPKVSTGMALDRKELWHALFVSGVHPGSSAERAGMKPGDTVTRIDGRDVAPLASSDVQALLQGADGSAIQVDVLRGKAALPLTFQLRREPRALVAGTRDPATEAVATLWFDDFEPASVDDERRRVDEILRASPRAPTGLIVDLRSNRGGPLDAALQVASTFAPGGSVVGYVATPRGETTLKTASPAALSGAARDWLGHVRIAVLVDADTRGTAALIASFLRERRGARIFGEWTNVITDVYTTIALADDTSMRIRTGALLSSTHADWSHDGVAPDEAIHPPASYARAGRDDVLYADALAFLDPP